jgi:excisionase family DNA binding protein
MALLTYEQAAQYLGTTPRHIRHLYQRRELPAVKVGKLVRFDVRDLERFVEARRVEATR